MMVSLEPKKDFARNKMKYDHVGTPKNEKPSRDAKKAFFEAHFKFFEVLLLFLHMTNWLETILDC
jgi:hypothetical protein